MDAGRRGRLMDWTWFLAWALASSLWCVTAARELGPTFDEPFYVTRGLEAWRTGSYKPLMKAGTMPLPVDVQTLPLYAWERCQSTRLDPVTDLDRLLPWARGMTLGFWWLLLVYARLAGRRLAGPWGGRLAVALIAVEPSLLAHATLATTDMAICACLVALAYHFEAGRESAWGRRVGLPAFWFGAAVLAKASGLVFGPLCLIVIEAQHRWSSQSANQAEPARNASGWRSLMSLIGWPFSATMRPFRRDLAQIMVGGLALVFVYCGSDWRTESTFVQWAQHLPKGAFASAMTWLSTHLRIFTNAGEGLIQQIKHNVRGHDRIFLLGRAYPRAVWYYFPVALTIKSSPALLILPAALALLRGRALLNWASLAALALLVTSVTCRVQIGIRFMLPLMALTAIGVAAAVVRIYREWATAHVRETGATSKASRPRPGLIAAGVLCCVVAVCVGWTASASLRVWPEGLCYTNELWGGTPKGCLRLSDSNYDWGQGLKELAHWEHDHGVARVAVWYYGTDPGLGRGRFEPLPLHALPIKDSADVSRYVRGRLVAASTTLLYAQVVDEPAYRAASAFLLARRPVARTSTFFIYDFTRDETPGLADARR
jgi:hypothetical protein